MTATEIASFEALAKQIEDKYYQAFAETVHPKNIENVEAFATGVEPKFSYELAHLSVDLLIACNGSDEDIILLRDLAHKFAESFITRIVDDIVFT